IFKTYTVKEYKPYKVKRSKKNNGEYERYIATANHPAIISEEMFNAVQEEKARRSNVDENGNRKNTHYSVKRRM
ncbi:recombinase family protein, partial [Eubacteriales bacterium OttesenSCG-928-A19]|nr:recombinase family protein [Eubacteriales bacterium OttesenSCG-928-A19]